MNCFFFPQFTCRHWTWPCLRAAFKLLVAKQPSCPAPSLPVLPSTTSTSFGWWYHCPMPTNLSRYWKNTPTEKKKKESNKQIQLLGSGLTFGAKSVLFPSFSVACRTTASDGTFLCHTDQSHADFACREILHLISAVLQCCVFCLCFTP